MAHAISIVETRRSTRASTGRPSSTPAWLRALAVLVVLGGARAADYWQQDGKNDGDPAPTCADEASTAAVRCCTPTASSCDSICTKAQNRFGYRTPLTGIDGLAASHAEAIAECAAHGWRLCTRAELAGVCIGTGCGMDNLLLWTLDGCSPPAPPLSPSPPPSPPSLPPTPPSPPPRSPPPLLPSGNPL